MRRFALLCALLGLVVASSSVSLGGEVRVALVPTPIGTCATLLGRSDFYADGAVPVVFYSGIIIPKYRLAFSKDDNAHTFQLGGEERTISFDGKSEFRMKVGGKEIALGRKRDGLAPQLLMFDKRRYTLAFPRSVTFLQRGVVWRRSGCVQQGALDKVEFALYDDNCDGFYDKKSDLIRLGQAGPAGVFAPIADRLPTPAGVVEVGSIAKDGSSISCTPYTGPTGRLVLRSAGRGVEYHVAIVSEDGKAAFATALSTDDRGGAVPQTFAVVPGKYKLLYGFAYSPGSRKVLVLLVPGETAGVEVGAAAAPPKPKPGEKPAPPVAPSVMAFGSGIHLAFKTAKKDNKIVFTDVAVVGGLGERYIGTAVSCSAALYKDPKDRRGTRVGGFTLKPGESEATLRIPTVKVGDKTQPVTGKFRLRVEARFAGFYRVSGEVDIEL